MNIIKEAAIPAIQRLDLRFYRAEEMSSLAVPIRFGDTQVLITIHADYLLDDDVMADVCVELNAVTDPEFHIGRAFLRLCSALEEEYSDIVRAAKPKRSQRPSRLDRDLSEILDQAGM